MVIEISERLIKAFEILNNGTVFKRDAVNTIHFSKHRAALRGFFGKTLDCTENETIWVWYSLPAREMFLKELRVCS